MKHFNSYLETVDLQKVEEFCRNYGKLKTFSADETFQKAGGNVRRFGYLVSGSIRYSCCDGNGRMHTVGYAFDNSFFADYSAFLRDIPAKLEITFIEKSEVYVVPSETIRSFVTSDIGQEHIFRLLSEDLFIRMEARMLDFYIKSPEERYIGLLQDCPDLFRRITLKEIAQYIGITPETLSRIRHRLTVRKAELENLPGG